LHSIIVVCLLEQKVGNMAK